MQECAYHRDGDNDQVVSAFATIFSHLTTETLHATPIKTIYTVRCTLCSARKPFLGEGLQKKIPGLFLKVAQDLKKTKSLKKSFKIPSHRVRGVDPDGDRLTFGVSGPDAELVKLEQQGDNQVGG